MRTPDEVAKATIEMVCGGVCLTVQANPGHIDPARVRQDLPTWVNRIRSQGLKVVQIKGPEVGDLDASVEAIIGTAAQNGITHYALGGYTYDLTKPLAPQLDAIKPRLERLVRLNERNNIKLVYHTRAGVDAVGGTVLDLLPIMRGYDPKFIGFHWDTGHMALHGDGMWETLMRLAGPYVASIGWRDRGWEQDLGLMGEGGPYAGPYPRVEMLVTQPDGSAIPGTPAAARAGGAGGGRAGGGGGGRGGGRGGGEDGEGAAPAPAAGRGTPRGPANSAGIGSFDNTNPRYGARSGGPMPKRPIGGKNAKGAGWSAPSIAMGMGALNLVRVPVVLRDINFNGPTTLESEYETLGTAGAGADKNSLPRQQFIGMLKRDVLTIRKSFEMAHEVSQADYSI
jgi:hypothetical protein